MYTCKLYTRQVQEELSPWDSWDEQKQAEKIRSVEEYRQRQQQLQHQQSQEQQQPEMDYFQDMAPQVKKQKKVLNFVYMYLHYV